ncbi:MAG: hypothetical protein J6M20_11790 [Clostridia bacterium]|nr:hypothetical protein [Clostridia bacterium]
MDKRLCHVLLVYRDMIPSIRLCGHGQMQWLAKMKHIEYRATPIARLKQAEIDWADVVLLGRLDNWFELQVAYQLHHAGKYLIYVMDDDLLNVPQGLGVSAYYRNEKVKRRIRKMIDMSQAVLSTSAVILEKYAKTGVKKAILTDGYLMGSGCKGVRQGKGEIRIGFAGSADRLVDVERILAASLFRIKEEYQERVQFEFFGVQPSFAKGIGARMIPYTDTYENYRHKLMERNWDIGLAPMPDTEFHACKYINKFIEYASADIVGVFSRVKPYIRMEDTPDIAVLCDNNEESWYQAIKALIDNPERCYQIREKACKYIQERFVLDVVAVRLKEDMQDVFEFRAPKLRRRNPLFFLRTAGTLSRMADILTVYGWETIPRAIRKIKRNMCK